MPGQDVEDKKRGPSVDFVIGAYPPSIGGAQLHTHALAKEMHDSFNAQVSVLCLWRESRNDWLLGSTIRLQEGTREESEDGIRVSQIGVNGRNGSRFTDYFWAGAYYFLRIQASRYFARRLDFPPLEGDVAHVIRLGREHLAMRAFIEANRTGRPVALTPNHHKRWSTRPDPSWRWMYRHADHVFALTDVEAKELQELGVGSDRLTVTGIGPVLSEHQISREEFVGPLGLPELRFIGYLGQQFPYKRVDLVVEVFDQLAAKDPDLGLLIAGPTSPVTRSLVNESAHRERIYILGQISTEVKTALLREIAVLVFPSEQESFGGVMLEAAWMGTPYVASNIPTLQEATSKIGLGISSSLEVDELAAGVKGFLDRPPSDREKVEVLDGLKRRFSWQALAGFYLSSYERLLENH